MALSMALGVTFGVASWIQEKGAPVGFAAWFGMIVYGLALGLTTCGLYDVAQGLRKPKDDARKQATPRRFVGGR